jgi:hypothetical protein
MQNRWLASGEQAERARRIAWAHAGFLAGEQAGPPELRAEVAQSWQRAAGASVDPDGGPPVVLAGGDLDVYRAAHPLAAVIGVLRELVGGAAEEGQHLMAVGDAAGGRRRSCSCWRRIRSGYPGSNWRTRCSPMVGARPPCG